MLVDGNTTTAAKGARLVLNPEGLKKDIIKAKASGLWDLLSPTAKRNLEDVQLVEAFVSAVSPDAGTSILAANIVSLIRREPLTALSRILRVVGTGKLLTSSFGKRILSGSAHRPEVFGGQTMRFMGSALAHASYGN